MPLRLIPFSTPLIQSFASSPATAKAPPGLQFASDWPHPDLAEAMGFFLSLREQHPTLEAWQFLMVNAFNVIVGDIGAKALPINGSLEVGYGVAESQRGQGHAGQALDAFLQHCASKGVHQVTAECSSQNVPSVRVLERALFTVSGERESEGLRLLCWQKVL